MLRFVALIMALMLACASMAVAAQERGPMDVPAEGYDGTEILPADEPWMLYKVNVENGHELVYELHVVGNGTFTVFLSPENDPLNYYVSFSTADPVTSFSRTFPADYGFDRIYYIEVNSTLGNELEYTVSIHTPEASTENYTIYYVLIALGFAALVIFSWKFVVWQDRNERREKAEKKRRKR